MDNDIIRIMIFYISCFISLKLIVDIILNDDEDRDER